MSTVPSTPPEILRDALERKARGQADDLASCVVRSQDQSELDGTQATSHLYHVKLDGNHRPMVADLIRLAASAVVDYAIPRSKAIEAQQQFEATGSAEAFTRLATDARRLFADVPLTGEGGELLLFLLAEKVLKLPQLFSKMSLKTSAQHHFNGTDALHAGTTDAGKLALYWGEAKMHATWQGGIDSAIRDISAYLRNDNGKCDRDVQLLSDHIDLVDAGLEEAVCAYLLPSSPHFKQAEYRGLVFVGFDTDAYNAEAESITADLVKTRVCEAYTEWSKRVCDKVNAEAVHSLALHVFLLPFPSVADFRAAFLQEIGGTNGN